MKYLLAVLLLGCGGTSPDGGWTFITSNGVKFSVPELPKYLRLRQENMEVIEELAINNPFFALSKWAQCLRDAKVFVTDETWDCTLWDETPAKCDGQYHENNVITLRAHRCEYQTAYLHELMHMASRCATWDSDPDHSNLELWYFADNESAVLPCE